MEVMMGVSVVLGTCLVNVIYGQEQCNGELWCEQGHCCGSDGAHCCTYYYELWWFWMIWGLIIMLSSCCLYQQHRLKKRQRRALRALQTGLQDGFQAHGQFNSNAESYLESEFRLPTYDEVQDLPKDPPAYELLFEAGRREREAAEPSVLHSDSAADNLVSLAPSPVMESSPHIIDDRDEVGLLDNEAVPVEDPPPAYTVTSHPTLAASLSSLH